MADLRPQWSEEAVGANHPIKDDVINRAWNVEHDEDGTHKPKDVDSFGGLAAAVATWNADGSDVTLQVTTSQTSLSANLTLNSNISLIVLKEGLIPIDAGKTLTINGPFEAGLYQVFSGTGSVSFGIGAVKEVYPQWKGAIGDDSTDNYAALNWAFSHALPVHIPDGTYRYATALTTTDVPLLTGVPGKTILKPTSAVASPALTINNTAQAVIGNMGHISTISGITLDGQLTTGARTGMQIGGNARTNRVFLDHTEIYEFDTAGSYGLHIRNGIDVRGSQSLISRNYINLLVDGASASFPTTVSFDEVSFREAESIGVKIVHGYAVSFMGCLFESNKAEGLYIQPGAAETALSVLLDNNCWFENNYAGHGSQTLNYSLIADGSAAGSTINLAIKNSYFNSSAAAERAIKLDKVTEGTIDNIRIASVANHLTITGGSSVSVKNWPQNAIAFNIVASITSSDKVMFDESIGRVQIAFTDGDTTPSISKSNTFSTGNTGPTTITDFDDGYVGKVFKMKFSDNVTVIDFTGTNLKGNGGVDWSPSNDDWMGCVKIGGNWYCSCHPQTGQAYTETNVTPDRAFDADTVAIAELADIVGTLIVDLRAKGIVK